MTFVRANPLGWAPFELLLSTQMNVIDSQMPFALDGQSGGIYESSGVLEYRNAVIISGDGITGVDPITTNILRVISPEITSGSDPIAASNIAGASNLGAGDGGSALLAVGGAAANAAAIGGVGITATGGANVANVGGAGVVANGGTGLIGGVGITGTAGVGSTPQGIPGIIGFGEADDGNVGSGQRCGDTGN